jgi:hypothetical protein
MDYSSQIHLADSTSLEMDASPSVAPTAVAVEGVLRLPELLVHLQARVERGYWNRPVFIDARKATIAITTQEVEQLIQALRKVSRALRSMNCSAPPARTAMLTKDPLNYGMARMYMSFAGADDPDFAVFYDKDLALAWLRSVD